jgi:sugar phosphate isomerase/epimerase
MPHYSRRDFTKLALALPAAGLLGSSALSRAADVRSASAGKPNSKVNGVQIGINVPYSFGQGTFNADEILTRCIQLGLSAVELRAQPVEAFLGAPTNLTNAKAGVAVGGAAKSNAEQLSEWRLSAPVERLKEFRKKYEDAGVALEVLKVDGIFRMSEPVLDYIFGMAKALGARAISTEISKNDDDHQRVGRAADKHGLMVGYHGHATTTPEHWEKAFSFAKHNGANVDIGHFFAGNGVSPAEFIKRYHSRVTHGHITDRKKQNGPNAPFGEGDTPIIEILRLIRDNRWPIQATIEFEYPVPRDSDRMTEIARAVKYCRDALA